MLIDIFAALFCLAIGVICFIASNNIILSLVVFGTYALAYFLLLRKRFKNYRQRIDIVHSCYQFITSFIVSLSVKPSLEDAYNSACRNQNKEFEEYAANLEENEVYSRIVYLRKFFNMAIYKLFINVLDIYQNQGGSIIQISDSLLKESNRIERSLRETINISSKKIIEFVLLWIITLGILIFMRFGLAQFYSKMINNVYFLIMLSLFFLFLLGSIVLFSYRFVSFSIKEDKI